MPPAPCIAGIDISFPQFLHRNTARFACGRVLLALMTIPGTRSILLTSEACNHGGEGCWVSQAESPRPGVGAKSPHAGV